MATKQTVKLSGGTGFYSGDYRRRHVQVEYQRTTAYGDAGWIAWVDNGTWEQVTDYPRRTRAEAIAIAVASIDASIDALTVAEPADQEGAR